MYATYTYNTYIYIYIDIYIYTYLSIDVNIQAYLNEPFLKYVLAFWPAVTPEERIEVHICVCACVCIHIYIYRERDMPLHKMFKNILLRFDLVGLWPTSLLRPRGG